ncbi:MAG: Ig-like domain-containing protein [Myxococcota bacterium]|nr:Ig-like domain-containing protein [Myxococcota bacterium]
MISLLLLGCQPQDNPTDTLVGILINPSEMIIPTGSSVQLKAFGLTEDRQAVDLTDSVTWNVEYYDVATVSNNLDSEGILTANGEGHTRIFAEYESIRSPYGDIFVTSAQLERLTIDPNEIVLLEGDSAQLKATGYFSNGESGDLTQQVRWITSDGSIAQLSEPGHIEGIQAGEALVHTEYESIVSDSIKVEVDFYNANGKPDLIIDNASGYIEDGYAIYEIKIKNQGSKTAVGFWFDIWVNRDDEPQIGQSGNDYRWIESIGPNHYQNLSFAIPYSGTTATSWFLIDTTDEQEESHEYNNTSNLDLEPYVPVVGVADLSVDYFDYYMGEDGSLNYFIDVTNNGTEAVPYFFVDLYPDLESPPSIGSDGEHYLAIENLSPGETRWADFVHPNACSGCRSWVMIDSYDFILELNEDNNIEGPLIIP